MNRGFIVVTGESGSGKSEFSSRLARLLDYSHVNVGDLLERELSKDNIHVPDRTRIGAAFFEHHSFEDYLSIIEGQVSGGVILDGVRFAKAVEHLRTVDPSLLHIHKNGPAQVLDETHTDRYSLDVPLLEGMADYVITWARTPEALDAVIEKLFGRDMDLPGQPQPPE